MEKYYTPESEEFYIGFECQHYKYSEDKGDLSLEESNYEDTTIISKYNIPTTNDECTFYRVKYLNQKDIEDIGFIKRLKNQWIGWEDYIKEITNPEYEYFMTITLHVPVMGNLYKIYVHRHLSSDKGDIQSELHNGESELVYKGLIKNKSELRKIMKQLNVI